MQRLQTLLSTATIPIVVLSSRDLANGEEASKRAGAVAHLQKPVDFEKLLKVIAEAIGTPESNP
jgi:CheY-like chemotaxis protein